MRNMEQIRYKRTSQQRQRMYNICLCVLCMNMLIYRLEESYEEKEWARERVSVCMREWIKRVLRVDFTYISNVHQMNTVLKLSWNSICYICFLLCIVVASVYVEPSMYNHWKLWHSSCVLLISDSSLNYL